MSRSQDSRWYRLLSAGALLLHVGVAGFGPVADALIERDQAETAVHVESEDRPSCPTGHDHLKCQLCRHVGTGVVSIAVVEREPHDHIVQAAETLHANQPLTSADPVLPVGSRAPPIA